VLFITRSLACMVGAAALTLAAGTAGAQFFPFLQQPQQQQRPPQPAPQQPQQARPSPPAQQPAPAKKTQPPAQKAQAVAPKPGQKPAPSKAAAPYGEVATACSTEIRSTCAGVVPGSVDSVQCLQRNFAAHLPPCQAALSRVGNVGAQPAAAPAAKPDQPAGTAEAPRRVSTDRITQPEGAKESAAPDLKLPAMRPTQEARWVNRYCREDHSLLCQGVTFGQSRVLRCLLSHHSSLKNDCRKALAKR
jgi:hypothetical protein